MFAAIIYLYISSNKEWQQLVHKIQDELRKFRNQFIEEKKRADIARDNLHKLQIKFEELKQALTAAEEAEKEYLDEIAKLKEQLEQSAQITDQYKLAKAEIERLSAEIAENEEHTTALKDEITRLKTEIKDLLAKQGATQAGGMTTHDNVDSIASDNDATTTPHARIKEGPDYSIQISGLSTADQLELKRLRERAEQNRQTIYQLEINLAKQRQENKEASNSTAAEIEESAHIQNVIQMLKESETCIKLLEDELDAMRNRNRELEMQLQNTLTDSAENSQTVAGIEEPQAIQHLNQKMNESETCVKLLEGELDAMQNRIRELEVQLENATTDNAEVGQTVAENEDLEAVQHLNQKLNESETCVKLLEGELEVMQNRIQELEAQL